MTLQHGNRIQQSCGKRLIRELQNLRVLEPASHEPAEAEVQARAREFYVGENGAPGSTGVNRLHAECKRRASRVTAP